MPKSFDLSSLHRFNQIKRDTENDAEKEGNLWCSPNNNINQTDNCCCSTIYCYCCCYWYFQCFCWSFVVVVFAVFEQQSYKQTNKSISHQAAKDLSPLWHTYTYNVQLESLFISRLLCRALILHFVHYIFPPLPLHPRTIAPCFSPFNVVRLSLIHNVSLLVSQASQSLPRLYWKFSPQ